MGLKFFSTQQTTPPERSNGPQPVIDSNSLREAALRASWHRDHHVARRREAWRWVIFWVWKYGRKAGLLLMPIAIAAFIALQFWPGAFKPKTLTEQTTQVPDAPASVAAAPVADPAAAKPSEANLGIRLVPAISLQPDTGASDVNTTTHNLSTQSPPQPLRLTPEIQTSPKESSP